APDSVIVGAFDKTQTLRSAEACGVEIPPTRYPTSLEECREAAQAVGYPCVVKPRFSSAWNGHGFLPDHGIAYASDATELAAAVLREWRGQGPARVEFRDEGTQPWLREVNGRFWGSLQLAIAAGCDSPRLWADVLTGQPLDRPTPYREGVTLRWLWGDVKRFL